MSNPVVELQQEFRDLISFIVQRVADDKRPDPVVVLLHLVAKLGEFLGAPGRGRIAALWRSGGSCLGVEWPALEENLGADPGPIVISSDALISLEVRSAGTPEDRTMYKPIVFSRWGKPCHVIRVSLSKAPEEGALEVSLDPPDNVGNERWTWLVTYLLGLGELHHTVRGLLVPRIGMVRERLKAEIHGIPLSRAVPLHTNLTETLRLLPQLQEIGAIDLIEELLVSLMLHVFGTGRRVRTMRREPAIAPAKQHPASPARDIVDQIRRYMHGRPKMQSERLLKLVSCLEAVIAPDVQPPGPVVPDDELGLLAVWTRVHELARSSRGEISIDAVKGAWESATSKTIPILTPILQRPLQERKPVEDTRDTRNWMTLWFCLQILDREHDAQPGDGEVWDLRSELAYVLRESLRLYLFGSRNDYFYDQEALVDSLARLIVHHSTKIIGLSPTYISSLMTLIGREGGENHYSATAHLQHVADIYVAGHFLLSVEIARGEGAKPAVELFAEYDVPDQIDRCRRAFSLAAIFHDVGHIFLPTDARLLATSFLPDDSVGRVLKDRETASRDQAVTLTNMCIEQLELAVPDPSRKLSGRIYIEDRGMADRCIRYFRKQADDGSVNHGLLGAWYLHRICEYALEMLRHEDQDPRSDRTQAVRAILLHDVLTAEIDADRDPIAALLVTCNEVFEWAPSRNPLKVSSLARSSQVGKGARAGHRLDRSIQIRHLEQVPDGSRLQLVLKATPSGMWPDITVELMPPEYLDEPILGIWLTKAQALGRIKPGQRSGFAPMLRIRSGLDPDLARCDLRTWIALQRALSYDYPEIVDWCSIATRFKYRQESRTEEVRLAYLKKHIYHGDIQALIPVIVRVVRRYIEALE